MSAKKAFYNKAVPTRNLITTFSGILLMIANLVVSVLLATGKISQDQAQPLNEILAGIIAVGGQLVGYVSALILMFKAQDA